MKRLCALFLLLIVWHASFAREAAPLAEDPVLEQRLIAISDEMRCLVCQNESLSGSRSDLAQDLRREIREMIQQGKSDDEIKNYMVSRYGDFVLYRPPVKPVTWLLWIGPFALMFLGVGALIAYLRRRERGFSKVSITDEERRRVQALLQEDEK
ncbi:MAG TPA: cytochrome c-type biogenesis protein [Burkholderiaceae bacterium]|nr:cytochrome c-type biogenesis protein [Burkholderiaceae bacterium]